MNISSSSTASDIPSLLEKKNRGNENSLHDQVSRIISLELANILGSLVVISSSFMLSLTPCKPCDVPLYTLLNKFSHFPPSGGSKARLINFISQLPSFPSFWSLALITSSYSSPRVSNHSAATSSASYSSFFDADT